MARKKKASVKVVRLSPEHIVQVALNTERIDRMEPLLARIGERLDSIEQSLQRNKGFWGAVTLIGGAIAAFLGLFKDSVLALLSGKAP